MSCPNNIEIERKFLVRDDSYKALATSSIHIRQGYLSRTPNCTIRVRIAESLAFLTIKSKPAPNGFAHYEFEKPISVDEANELLQLALPGIIDKRRWLVPLPPVPCHLSPAPCNLPPVTCNLLVCEVDEFFGDNAGLVMAEVELPSEDTPFVHPDFLGDEVTFDKRYYNSYLSQHPFTTW
ncbi:MAG: CYTH domain-containing protein [Paludibacteraceae bacterium]|nr:CYTH domain-containing protein [Paludibacteraceae bacterium]